MTFRDRADAGNQLASLLKKDPEIQKNPSDVVVVSLLRGGVVVGEAIAKNLHVAHLPLVVTKIPAPYNPELAIGALCFDFVYLEPSIVNSLALDQSTINNQIQIAKEKFNSYLERFQLKKDDYQSLLKDKVAILVDDGIATGSTARAGLLYLKTLPLKKVYLASPVAPDDFDTRGFDKTFIIVKESFFSAVSQFYQSFPQVSDEEVKKILKHVY